MTATNRRNGLVASAVIVVACLVVAAALPVSTLTGPLAVYILSALPTLIVLDGMWAARTDGWLSQQSRVVRGAILLATILAVGGVVYAVAGATVGGGQGPSTPQITMYSIVCVVAAFWLSNMWQTWPFLLIPDRIVGTAALIVSVYAVATAIYYALFDFTTSFPPQLLFSATPTGAFEAWHVLSFLVCFLGGIFLVPAFGLMGIGGLAQPLRGLAWTAISLVWGGLVFGIGMAVADDPVKVMLWGGIPVLFGGLVVLVVFRNSIFGHLKPPVGGLVTFALVIVVGVVLVALYAQVGHQAHSALTWDAPTYQIPLWVASATLSFTFPILAAHANIFGLAPLPLGPKPAAPDPAKTDA